MQAGETLNFIQPFNGFEQQDDDAERVSEKDVEILVLILRRFVNEQQDNVHSFPIFEDDDFITVFESSYRLDMSDGSHLHIVVYGSQNDEGMIDFGVSVNEHLDDGSYNGGHSYLYDRNGLKRSTAVPDLSEEIDEEDRELLRRYFMPSDHYAEIQYVMNELQSDDPERRLHAEQMKRQLDEVGQFEELAEMSGFDGQPPYPGEMEKVLELISSARPFPLHESQD